MNPAGGPPGSVRTAILKMPKNKSSKRYRQALELVGDKQTFGLDQALEILAKFPKAKFDETVEIAFKLGVDPRKSDQMVRGTVPLPHGSGKEVRVIVFAKSGPAADAAREAGAIEVGFEDLIEKCKAGWTDFDVAVATPEAMVEVRKLGKVLGPRGLMPNPKTGTVTDDTANAVNEFRAGRVEYKVDKTANLHVPVGRVSFPAEKLSDNIKAVVDAVDRSKPSSIKGTFMKSCTIAATMSPGIRLDLKQLIESH